MSPPAGNLQSPHPLLAGLLVSGAATLVSHAAPSDWAATLIGGLFLGATYYLCLRAGRSAEPCGLALGGLLDNTPLRWGRLLGEGLKATAQAALMMAAITPTYIVAFIFWFNPEHGFSASRGFQLGPAGWPELAFLDLVLGHLLVVALPEEAFFRGYLQTALQERWPPRKRVLRAHLGSGVLVTSALFALGHLASLPDPSRLAVFFPSLLFGWLRNLTGGIGAAVITHACCNVLVAVLLRGFALA